MGGSAAQGSYHAPSAPGTFPVNKLPNFEPLVELYGRLATVVTRAGATYPAAVKSASAPATGKLVVEAPEPVQVDGALRREGQPHLAAVAARTRAMHDGRVLSFTRAEAFPVQCAAGGYFDAIATSDSLRAEYLNCTEFEVLARDPLSVLPMRRIVHQLAAGDPLRSGHGRVAAIGVSVLTTVPVDHSRAVVLGLRSASVATDPNQWHVAPSGTLEPGVADAVNELVERELSEEVGVRLNAASSPASRWKVLGVGFDLLRLRPEICVRIDLHDDEVPESGLRLDEGEFQDSLLLELTRPAISEFWRTHPPQTVTPAAAAALALLEHAGP